MVKHSDISNLVKEINSIVRKSFGWTYSADYDMGEQSTGCPLKLEKINKLLLIGRNKYLGRGHEYIGQLAVKDRVFIPPHERFEDRLSIYDGSIIAVLPEYAENAEKYAMLYKEKIGKDVVVILTNDIGPYKKEALRIRKLGEELSVLDNHFGH